MMVQIKILIDIFKKHNFFHSVFIVLNIFILKIINKVSFYPFGYTYPYIHQIQLEPTKKCNMKCPMCLNSYLNEEEKGNMSYENFLTIVDQFPYLTTVRLQGLGESLMNPEIFKMIDYLKKKGISVGFADNGSLLSEKNINKLLSLKIDFISLSLDTLDPIKYKQIRGVDLFYKVKENIESLVKAKKRNGAYKNTRVLINMVLTNGTIDELSSMIDYAKQIGVKEIIASIPQKKYSPAQIEFINRTSNVLNDKKNQERIFYETKIKAKIYKINLRFNLLKFHYAKKCLWNFSKVYITWDGYITPCCHIENPSVYNFGNILKDSFKKIWNNPHYRNFRKKHLDLYGVCKNCPYVS
ncbi:MAG: radical SAM/SPASM domain-containing protein [bacterium]